MYQDHAVVPVTSVRFLISARFARDPMAVWYLGNATRRSGPRRGGLNQNSANWIEAPPVGVKPPKDFAPQEFGLHAALAWVKWAMKYTRAVTVSIEDTGRTFLTQNHPATL